MDFQDYLRLLEAIEDEGLIIAMKEVENETPLNLNEALAELKRVNTQYIPSFIKDLKALKSTPYYESIKKFAFEEIIEISSFAEITNIKKLQGYDNAYRIRIGDYRLGIIFDGETLIFERVLHRKEIYRYFPK